MGSISRIGNQSGATEVLAFGWGRVLGWMGKGQKGLIGAIIGREGVFGGID